MTEGIPKAEFVFELSVTCDAPENIGTLDGGHARMIPITGGTVTGERLNGIVLPGGADWSITRQDGRATVDARYAIRADDGTIIQVFNGATARIDPARMASLPYMMVTSPRFIAPEGRHDWLNEGVFVGTLKPDLSGRTSSVMVRIFVLA